ncbi:MAG: PD-(D/E)XK nuclease family protein, partial [Candidatus Diapherotrites archaeon]
GIVDKTMQLFGQGMAIVDYKTSKSSLPHSISERDLKQCKAYAYLWNAKFQEMPRFVSIFYLRDGESVYYPISERDLKEIEDDVKNIRGREKDKPQFELKPQTLCKYCDFFSKCYASEEDFLQKRDAEKANRNP